MFGGVYVRKDYGHLHEHSELSGFHQFLCLLPCKISTDAMANNQTDEPDVFMARNTLILQRVVFISDVAFEERGR